MSHKATYLSKISAIVVLLNVLAFSTGAFGARPFNSPVQPTEFTWRGNTVRNYDELYQLARTVTTQEDADDLRATLDVTQSSPDFLLGYLLGEFSDRAEQVRFARLFRAEHPMMGTVEEMQSFTPHFFMALGMLSMRGFHPSDLKTVRAIAKGITESQSKAFVSQLSSMETVTPTEVLEMLRKVMSCGSSMHQQ